MIIDMAKVFQDPKLVIQLAFYCAVAGMFYQTNRSTLIMVEEHHRVLEQHTRSIIIIEERFEQLRKDNMELKDLIRRLEKRLEDKKIVHLLTESPAYGGESLKERK